MSTIENEQSVPERPNPPPAENVGKNHKRFILLGALTFSGVAWIFGLYLYSFIYGPMDVLERGDYLRTEVSFNLIPALPDSLADSYDMMREEQLANIETMGMSSDIGMANIPIDEAIDFLLENDGYPVGDDVVVPPDSDMEDTGDQPLDEVTEEPTSGGFQELDATSEEITPEADSEAEATEAVVPEAEATAESGD